MPGRYAIPFRRRHRTLCGHYWAERWYPAAVSNPDVSAHALSSQGGGSPLDGLSFLDLIFTVPVGDLAMRVSGAKLDRVSAGDWSALAMILTVIVLSWIGMHKDRKDLVQGSKTKRDVIGEFPFFGPRFVQFVVEVVIIGLYFVMGLNLTLPTPDHLAVTPLPEESLTEVLLWIFIAYFVWDILDVWLARHGGNPVWQATAAAGGKVTFLFSVAVTAIFVTTSSAPPRTVEAVVWWNLVLIVLLYGYRVAQDKTKKKAEHKAWAKEGEHAG